MWSNIRLVQLRPKTHVRLPSRSLLKVRGRIAQIRARGMSGPARALVYSPRARSSRGDKLRLLLLGEGSFMLLGLEDMSLKVSGFQIAHCLVLQRHRSVRAKLSGA